MKETIFPKRLFKFILVGGVNVSISFGLFSLFNQFFGIDYLLSVFWAFVCWSWFGYELQRVWVFSTPVTKLGFIRFLGNQLIFFLLSAVLMLFLVEILKIQSQIAYLMNLFAISLGVYLSSILFVFKEQRDLDK